MKRTKHGFTLVELLVVITIIGILMGLLIPAVNAARETARRNQCATNMKNMALAGVQYENAKKSLPSYISKYGVFSPTAATATDPSDSTGNAVNRHIKVGGYGVALLPWLDAQPTYEHWTQDRYPIIANASSELGVTNSISGPGTGAGFHKLAAPNLAIFQCPSNPVTDAQEGRNSYISNNGMAWYRSAAAVAAAGSSTSASPGVVATHAAAQTKANGTSNCGYLGTSPSAGYGIGPSVSLDDLKDGQGFTALYSENVQALPWYLPGFLNGPNLEVAAPATDVDWATVNVSTPIGEMVGAQFSSGWVWHYEDEKATGLAANLSPAGLVPMDVYSFHKINGGGLTVSDEIFTLQMTKNNAIDLARPSSAHVSGVNVAFADGATRFVTDSINYRVYQAILTPRGKSSDVPWKEFVLTDELE